MPTITLEAKHQLSCRLKAENVDRASGIIYGATVAKSGVQATGKYVMLDAKGEITRNPEEMASEVPVYTDDETLLTLMLAAEAAGEYVKVREDHIEEIGRRAGYADTFELSDDGRVTANIHLNDSYENRAVVLETALKTPKAIGLSIDFIPTFELRDGKALMRVSELNAVDVVDCGAITPDGLFLSAGVDTTRKVETGKTLPPETMAAPTSEELMSAISTLTTTVGTLAKSVSENQAALAKLTAAPPTPATDPKVEEALKAANEAKEQLAAQKQEIVQMKREKALLGFRGSSEERAKLATAQPEEIEKAASEKKDYLALVAERAESAKCKRSEAHVWVMKNHRDEYAAHLASKGVIRVAA